MATNQESADALLDIYRRGVTRVDVGPESVGTSFAVGGDLAERIKFFEGRAGSDTGVRRRVSVVRLSFGSGLDP